MFFKKLPHRLFFLVAGLFILSCKKTNPAPAPEILPVITVLDATAVRNTTNTTITVFATLNKAYSKIVTVEYSLADGTAQAPRDYIAAAGTITFPANQTSVSFPIQIVGDPTNLRQNNISFKIQLSNPQSGTVLTNFSTVTIITENGTYLPTDNSGYTTPLSYAGYNLVWNDEFSGTTLNNSNWNQEIGNGTNGWGNNELEYYTNSLKNTFLSNGNLIVEARNESIGGFNYSSGRLTTQNKKAFKFGRIDIRAKLPVGKGIWPALWMLGTNITTVGWPACGEIDIMELIGSGPSRVYSTMHWKPVTGTNTSNGGNYNLSSGDFSQQFHVFSIIWTNNSIQCLVDDQLFFTNTIANVSPANYPFNADHFFLFNVAVGGNWPGAPDASTSFPQRMFVDYVRVFQ